MYIIFQKELFDVIIYVFIEAWNESEIYIT